MDEGMADGGAVRLRTNQRTDGPGAIGCPAPLAFYESVGTDRAVLRHDGNAPSGRERGSAIAPQTVTCSGGARVGYRPMVAMGAVPLARPPVPPPVRPSAARRGTMPVSPVRENPASHASGNSERFQRSTGTPEAWEAEQRRQILEELEVHEPKSPPPLFSSSLLSILSRQHMLRASSGRISEFTKLEK